VWRGNGIKDCAISSNGGKSLHELYCTIIGIVATVVSLINSLGGAVRKLSNIRSNIPLCEKYGIVVLLNSENGTKVAKLAKDFDIYTKTLTKFTKKRQNNFSFFLTRAHAKTRYISCNPNQRTLLSLARLWHSTKKSF